MALAVALVCAGLFVVLAGADSGATETADTPLLDRPAPDAVGELADGTTFDLARRKGSWVVLNFFDPECVPCVQEHPELRRSSTTRSASLGNDGAELVTVVFRDDRDGVAEFFADEGGDWPVVYDDDGSIATAFGVTQVPETWIIDPNGVVRWRTISTVTADQLESVDRPVRADAPGVNRCCEALAGVAAAGRGRGDAVRRRRRPRQRRQRSGRARRRPGQAGRLPGVRR